MSFSTFVLILISVALSAAAQISFKIGVTAISKFTYPLSTIERIILYLLTPGVIIGLVLYGIGTLLWLQVLSKVDVSQAYPFVGVGFVLTAMFGAIMFGETITLVRMLGIILVIGGIYLVARS